MLSLKHLIMFHITRAEFVKDLQEQREKLFAQFNSLKNDNSTQDHKLLKLISQTPPPLKQVNFNKDPGFQVHISSKMHITVSVPN